ncbi:GntR family transcriptional regulator, partial [Streptomyces cellulosae]
DTRAPGLPNFTPPNENGPPTPSADRHARSRLAANRPKWVQVQEVIAERIRTGVYPPGGRIPSVVQLQAEFGIATATGQKVMRGLREAGLIETVPGMGSFVRED